MKTAAFAALLAVCLTLPVQAQHYVSGFRYYDGFVSADGYTYRNGYFWRGGNQYTFTEVPYAAGYDRYNCYYPAGFYLRYTQVYSTPVYTPPATATTYPSDADIEIILLAKAKLLATEKRLLEAEKAKARIALADALGVRQEAAAAGYLNVGIPYGIPGYSYSGNYYQATYPIQASTNFAYSVSQLVKAQEVDSAALLQQLVAQSIQSTDRSLKQFGDNAAADADRKAKLAADKQQLDALIQAIIEVRKSTTASTKGYSFTVQPNGQITTVPTTPAIPQVMPGAPADNKEALRQARGQLLATKCVNCHYGSKISGKFDIATYFALSQTEKQRIKDVVAGDKMPPQSEPRLTTAEKALLIGDVD